MYPGRLFLDNGLGNGHVAGNDARPLRLRPQLEVLNLDELVKYGYVIKKVHDLLHLGLKIKLHEIFCRRGIFVFYGRFHVDKINRRLFGDILDLLQEFRDGLFLRQGRAKERLIRLCLFLNPVLFGYDDQALFDFLFLLRDHFGQMGYFSL